MDWERYVGFASITGIYGASNIINGREHCSCAAITLPAAICYSSYADNQVYSTHSRLLAFGVLLALPKRRRTSFNGRSLLSMQNTVQLMQSGFDHGEILLSTMIDI
jgi:hypothetical protein